MTPRPPPVSSAPPPSRPGAGPPDVAALLDRLQAPAGAALGAGPDGARPLHGTTLFLARCTVETVAGPFAAHVFQDLIHHGYLIALSRGDPSDPDPDPAPPALPARIHSSCVTSETLRACDCDCRQQLEGALAAIAARGRGLVVYLLQEGRGVGYLAKARDRMLVQASGERVSTFEAYTRMGLREDHRSYESVPSVLHLLGVRAPLHLLTNNPAKPEALRRLGVEVAGTTPLQIPPTPFNVAYLAAKARSGHHLGLAGAPRPATPPDPVEPFQPRALPGAARFILAASYHLPLDPVGDEVLLTRDHAARAFGDATPVGWPTLAAPLVRAVRPLRRDRWLVRVDRAAVEARRAEDPADPVAAALVRPWWFRVHVYFDVVTAQEFVVLTHGTPGPGDRPVVRLHSESLLDRFPLSAGDGRRKYEAAIRHIVEHGAGGVVLLPWDGRGAGFGALATDRMLVEAGLAADSDAAFRRLGIATDRRDYDACALLLRHHFPGARLQVALNSASSLVRKPEIPAALHAAGLEVDRWIFLEEPAD